jgi:hypothetical protein
MAWKYQFSVGLALLLGGAVARAQMIPAPPTGTNNAPFLVQPQLPVQVPEIVRPTPASPSTPGAGAEPESRPAERSEEAPAPKLGPTPVEDVGFLMNNLGLKNVFGDSGIRTYGWLEAGYTYASVGPGLLATETRENRFGDQFLLNQIGIVLDRPLKQDELSWGFNVTYWAGADPSLIQPKGGIDDPPDNPRFSHDFRQLYLSAHLPILTEGGVDVKAGRMGTIIGYNGALAPYRPFYSSDYQWFYSQDGAWTGFLTNWHVNKQLDILNGMTFGANTFFTKRSSDSICYIGQINYWLQEDKKTLLTASIHAGPDAIFAAPGLAGDFDTVVELRIQQNWNEYFTQIIQSNMGWDTNTPVGTGSWYGLYTIGIVHLNCTLDALVRAEWFDDVRGTRTGVDANYGEITLGTNWHPNKYLEFRPEIRGDFADKPAFGPGGSFRDHSQLTVAVSALIKF